MNEKLNRVIEQHQAVLRTTIQSLESKMDEKLRARSPQGAYDVWKDFPQNLRTLESDPQIGQILHAISLLDLCRDRTSKRKLSPPAIVPGMASFSVVESLATAADKFRKKGYMFAETVQVKLPRGGEQWIFVQDHYLLAPLAS